LNFRYFSNSNPHLGSFFYNSIFDMNQYTILLPDYKKCSWCQEFLVLPQMKDGDYYFYCNSCLLWVNWREKTPLAKSKIPYENIKKLLLLYIKNQSPTQAYASFETSFNGLSISKNTISKYFKFFGDIALSYYQHKLNSTLLNGEVEVDETVMFRSKKTRAKRYRKYKLQSNW